MPDDARQAYVDLVAHIESGGYDITREIYEAHNTDDSSFVAKFWVVPDE